jgi:hypothetical protein
MKGHDAARFFSAIQNFFLYPYGTFCPVTNSADNALFFRLDSDYFIEALNNSDAWLSLYHKELQNDLIFPT